MGDSAVVQSQTTGTECCKLVDEEARQSQPRKTNFEIRRIIENKNREPVIYKRGTESLEKQQRRSDEYEVTPSLG